MPALRWRRPATRKIATPERTLMDLLLPNNRYVPSTPAALSEWSSTQANAERKPCKRSRPAGLRQQLREAEEL
jgi:hypothetical protein